MFPKDFHSANVFALARFAHERASSQAEIHAVAGPKVRIYNVGPSLVDLTHHFVQLGCVKARIKKKKKKKKRKIEKRETTMYGYFVIKSYYRTCNRRYVFRFRVFNSCTFFTFSKLSLWG
jgi:hypothetical protein